MPLFRWFSRRKQTGDRAEEMQAHIDLYAEELQARGVSAEDAAREARLKFGNLRVKREEVAALNRLPLIDTAWREIRFATRSLRRSPSFTGTVVAVLALAIGAAAVVFTIVDTTILRGLPFDRSDRLVAIGGQLQAAPSSFNPLSAAHFLALKTRTDVFQHVAGVTGGSLTLKRDVSNEPQTIRGQRVTADFFDVLRIVPAHGRFFTSEHEVEGLERVAVISHGLSQRLFGGAADAVGKRLTAEQGDFEILGVAPEGFSYPVGALEPTEVWMPYVVPADERVPMSNLYLQPIARLQDDASIELALERLNAPDSGVTAAFPPNMNRPTDVRLLHDHLTRQARPWLLMLLAASACVLLIACVNLANLVLVRASVRAHELQIRTALGASRWNVARSLLTEGLVVSVAGVTIGLLLAWWGIDILRALMPFAIPRQDAIAIDLRVLTVAVATAVGIGVMLGLAPMMLHARRHNASLRVDQNRSHTTSRAAEWLRSTFVVSEVALAIVLLVGAVLFLASFSRVMSVDLGFDYRNVLSVQVRPTALPAGGEANRAALLRVTDRAREIPGVNAVSLAIGTLPLAGGYSGSSISIPGREGENFGAAVSQVSPDYFSTLKIPIRQGRAFTSADVTGSDPVVILNEAAVTELFGTEDPIGRVIGLQGQRTIVGIVGNVRSSGPAQDATPGAFLPFAQSRAQGATLLVSATRLDAALVSQITAIVRSEFPDILIPLPRPMEQDFASYISVRRFNMLLLTVFGALGLLIAAIGIYGVMAYVVSQRTREIGIRKALGAQPSTMLWSVLRRASVQMGLGLAIGLSAAWMMDGLVASFLFNVEARELGLYAMAAGVLIVAGIIAALLPALRAARVDPVVALRAE